MALIKSSKDISTIRQAGQILAEVLQTAQSSVKPGITTEELDQAIHQQILKAGATPSFLGYEGFPKSSCLSVNHQVVHGIPGPRVLQEGDIIGVDIGLWYKDVCVDAAITCPVGTITPERQNLLTQTKRALEAGIKAAKPYRRIGAISHAIQQVAEEHNLGIVRALTGHGVGHHVHEHPEIPNFGRISDGILLKPGMVLAIEPMFTLGSSEVLTEVDGWGVITADHTPAAHFEHTVIITTRGAEVVTKTLANQR